MKFPYGMCDFYDIITENYFYVDRTNKIPLIEKTGKYLFFLRPRRFGKSLVLSMLENYYDVAKTKEFEQLFGTLARAHSQKRVIINLGLRKINFVLQCSFAK